MKYLIPQLPDSVKQAEENGNFRLAGGLIENLLRRELLPLMKERLEFKK